MSTSAIAKFLTNVQYDVALNNRTSEEFQNLEKQIIDVVSFMLVVFVHVNQRQS